MLIMLVSVVVVMMIVVSVPVLIGMHVELNAFDAGFVFAGGVEMEIVQVQFLQFAFELFERDAKIEQGADEHIAADAAENIEVKRFHFAWVCSEARELIWLAA